MTDTKRKACDALRTFCHATDRQKDRVHAVGAQEQH